MRSIITLLLIVTCTVISFSQLTITGKVVDEEANPLPGVNIVAKGDLVNTVSNLDGTFSFNVETGYETIVFSLPDYQPRELLLSGETTLSITLYKIESNIDSEPTQSVSYVDVANLSPAPLVNLEQSNQGVTAGLFVQNTSGTIGEGTKVRVRGGSSLTASNQPLYVVDGVPLTSTSQSNLNSSNIQSIEVLKDAAASAIYGTRAANGVILITTKDGGQGGFQANVEYQFGINRTPKKLDLQTGDDYLLQTFEFTTRTYYDAATGILLDADPTITFGGMDYSQIDRSFLTQSYRRGNTDITFTASDNRTVTFNMPDFYQTYLNMDLNTDWQDEVFQTGASNRVNVDFRGGSEQLSYFTSFAYNKQEGILIGNDWEVFNATLSLNSKINSQLSARLNLNYIGNSSNLLPENQDLGFPLQAIVLPPSDEVDPSNNYRLKMRSLEYTPLAEINFSDRLNKNNSLLGNLSLNYVFDETLTFNMSGGVDISDTRNEIRQGPETLEGSPNGLSSLGEEEIFNYLFNGSANYSPKIGSQNKLMVTLGGAYQVATTDFAFRQAQVNSISTLEGLSAENLTASNPIPSIGDTISSAYLTADYAYSDLYTLQVTARFDRSSKFSEENRNGFFPAISAGWNIHNAAFFSSNTINALSLRASYGLVGNTPVDNYLYRNNYLQIEYDDREGLELSNLANTELKWETTSQLNVGLDYGFLSGRINGSVDYYIKETTDLLFPIPVTLTSGFGAIIDNIGTMENRGFEFSISSVNVSSSDFEWRTDFNIAFNQNEITDLDGEQAIVGVNAFLEGQPAGVFYMREYAGVDEATGQALYSDGNGGTTTDWESAPRQVMGDPNPDYFGGLTNAISYKNFDFSFLIQYVGGADLYFATGEYLANSGILNLGQLATQNDRWYSTSEPGTYPALDINQDTPFPSSRWLEDGSYIRLKTITLNYNFPASTLNLRSLSAYVSAQNLFTITDYIGYDPDVSYFDPLDGIIGQNISRGIDNFSTPQAQMFLAGIKIGL